MSLVFKKKNDFFLKKLIFFLLVEDATEHLLNLSPFELKIMLHMVISGKELGVTSVYSSKTDASKTEQERRLIRDELKVIPN